MSRNVLVILPRMPMGKVYDSLYAVMAKFDNETNPQPVRVTMDSDTLEVMRADAETRDVLRFGTLNPKWHEYLVADGIPQRFGYQEPVAERTADGIKTITHVVYQNPDGRFYEWAWGGYPWEEFFHTKVWDYDHCIGGNGEDTAITAVKSYVDWVKTPNRTWSVLDATDMDNPVWHDRSDFHGTDEEWDAQWAEYVLEHPGSRVLTIASYEYE